MNGFATDRIYFTNVCGEFLSVHGASHFELEPPSTFHQDRYPPYLLTHSKSQENQVDMSANDHEMAKVAADAERELVRLWRAWRTIHEMCQDRVCAWVNV